MSKESKIILSIMAVILVGVGVLVAYVNQTSNNIVVTQEKLIRENSHIRGEGEVKIVEFGDYQCPACSQAHPVTKQILQDFEGKVAFVYRNFPLPRLHPNARAAAEAAEAAGAQGKFWEMHDKLYETQEQWSVLPDPVGTFVKYATDLGLDATKFKEDVTNEANKERIDSDQSDGYNVGVSGTPTFFVNGRQQKNFDYSSLKSAIEAELNNTK